ncbi:MAG: phosphate ABC transporter, permease protein PstA, partial [Proteobacteria bacterium SW_6_67_9]
AITGAATVLPAQIFTWAGMPEQAYESRTAAAILVLLGVLIALNATAVYLRKKFERRW